MFAGLTAPAFDPLSAASTAADMAVRLLLRPERAARLLDFHRRDPSLPGLEEVLDALEEQAFGGGTTTPERLAELRRVVQWVVVRRLIGLAGDPQASAGVRPRVEAKLRSLAQSLGRGDAGDSAAAAHRSFLAREIDRYLTRAAQEDPGRKPDVLPPPPGQPIGLPEALFSEDGCSWEG
jgi:hypothetical protein